MKNKEKIVKKNKMPVSIILIIAWMIFLVIRNLAKLVNLERFELNKGIFGSGLAIFNYILDAIILLALIIIIVLFILRKKNAWEYFIALMVVLIIGTIVGFFYVQQTIALFPPETHKFISSGIYIFLILLIIFYIFLSYIIYKKRGYFER